MGWGKSTIAKLLSEKINIPHIDLDDEIEKNNKMKISQLFDSQGEVKFRKIENEVLTKILKSKNKSVISLGGGTPCYYDNMNLINSTTDNVFFINCSSKILTKRLFYEKKTRPLISHIQSEKELLEFVSKHSFERIKFYNKAKTKIYADNKDLSEICDEIIKRIT